MSVRALDLRNELRGEAECLVVYSDQTHVEYVYSLLFQLEKVLKDKGFDAKRHGEEIRSSDDYLETLEKLVDNCVLGLIILDGFRPNILFEFGYLKAKTKPIIILQSTEAKINVKTLYKKIKDSGLTSAQFRNRLSNPKLDIKFHLSDFAGKHISFMNWQSKDSDPLHPTQVLNTEIDKKIKEIIEETIARALCELMVLELLTSYITFFHWL